MEDKFSSEFMEQVKNLAGYIQNYSGIIESQADKIDQIFDSIENASSIHLGGKGRSGSVAVSLALRLSHFGYKIYFLGDVIKEPFTKGDVLILFSGSGDTSEVVELAKKGKSVGAKVISITSFSDSSIAKNSDIAFILPGGLEKGKGWSYVEAQLSHKNSSFYGGGEFELNAYFFQEALVSAIGKYKNISGGTIVKKHEKDETFKSA